MIGSQAEKVLMIFVDGVGIGENDSERNPFFKHNFKFLTDTFGDIPHLGNQRLTSDNFFLFPVDACMGVPDLPQSGTGQTSIFCGVNAPEIYGRHFGPFPPSPLIPVLKEKNIFNVLKRSGAKVFFANAYPELFFDYISSGKKRLSVTSLSCLLSDVRLQNENDLRAANALSAEIDNKRWVDRLGYDLEIIDPDTAAARLLNISRKNNFTLFEFFLTDHLGHWRIKDQFDHIINVFDRFLLNILSNLDPDTTLIVCSDHGNFEDISVKQHTRNPALAITAGKHASEFSDKIKSLEDIQPAIISLFERDGQ